VLYPTLLSFFEFGKFSLTLHFCRCVWFVRKLSSWCFAFSYGLLLFTQKEKTKIERLYSGGRRYYGCFRHTQIAKRGQVLDPLMWDFALLHFLGNQTGVAFVPFGFCVVWPLYWLGTKQGKMLYWVLKGFGCFCVLSYFLLAKRSIKWFVYLLFLLYPCVVLVLDNVFYITPHNCKVHLILVVGDGSKILDYFFPYRL
jgi:hypothetical protein